ncbi:MAG: ABC transporter ATP-binding protein [Bacteroidales bacterium]|nr:ABC transporter ATP-binding protein [Bacteroidales bacterium]MDY0215432.1 ABC transporter ATP-binding protein [Bacteroidales bacterium]
MIKVKNIHLGFNSKTANTILLEDVSFDLSEGMLYSILGSNGKGKTTLMKALTAFHKPMKGEVLLQNKNINSYSYPELSRLISVVFTEKTQVEYMSVFEMVSLGRAPYTGFYGTLDNNDLRVISNSMNLCGISHLKQRNVATLSDGEYQKTLIAKALAQETPIIFMDEPANYLDAAGRITLMKLLRNLVRNENKTIVLSMHEIDLALKYSDKILMFNGKKKLKVGMPEDLILNGSINGLFASQGLVFNIHEGIFHDESEEKVQVKIDVPEILKIWILNALKRYEVFSSNSAQNISISMNNDLFVYQKDSQIIGEFETIEALVNHMLKNIL